MEWCSVKDRLPAREGDTGFSVDVLVWDQELVYQAYYVFDGGYWASELDVRITSCAIIKWWMPRPEPPQEGR